MRMGWHIGWKKIYFEEYNGRIAEESVRREKRTSVGGTLFLVIENIKM